MDKNEREKTIKEFKERYAHSEDISNVQYRADYLDNLVWNMIKFLDNELKE